MLQLTIAQINTAILRSHGNKKDAAALLGISSPTLWRRLREYKETGVISPINVRGNPIPAAPPVVASPGKKRNRKKEAAGPVYGPPPVSPGPKFKGVIPNGTDWRSIIGHDFRVVGAVPNIPHLPGAVMRVMDENVMADGSRGQVWPNFVLLREVYADGSLAQQPYYLPYGVLSRG